MKNQFLVIGLAFLLPSLSFAEQAIPPQKTKYELLSHEDQMILDNGEIDNGHYVGGGIAGSLLGFGAGHAIQGRYSEKGWIFTAGELGSIVLLAVGAGECTVGVLEGTGCATGAGLMFGGYLGFFGFKIWEIIDLWVAPPELNRRYRGLKDRVGQEPGYQLMVSPIVLHRAPGLGLAVYF